jgi:hypothetical protein
VLERRVAHSSQVSDQGLVAISVGADRSQRAHHVSEWPLESSSPSRFELVGPQDHPHKRLDVAAGCREFGCDPVNKSRRRIVGYESPREFCGYMAGGRGVVARKVDDCIELLLACASSDVAAEHGLVTRIMQGGIEIDGPAPPFGAEPPACKASGDL